MPLRKKHVRRLVLALLAVGVLGPIVGLAGYAAWLGGGAYGRAVESDLSSRLRCDATVRGARPTGVATAAADSADLVWNMGDGRLAITLSGLRAESNSFGWYVTADEGSLALAGPAPWETLAALNQRLVQAEAPRLMAVSVKRLRIDLDLDRLRAESTALAVGASDSTVLAVHFYPPDRFDGATRGPSDAPPQVRPAASLRLNPTSGHGVFDGLRAEAKDVPLDLVARVLKADGGKTAPALRGSADATVEWFWPPSDARRAVVKVAPRGIDLAQWTAALPGGPLTGTGEIAVTYAKGRHGPATYGITLDVSGGTIAGETLRWLEGLPAAMTAAGPISAKTIAFDRLSLRCRIVGDRGQFEGPRDATGAIPLVTCRLFAVEVPILKASARTFDAGALWTALKPALAPPAEKK
jgi:hypothetical protein